MWSDATDARLGFVILAHRQLGHTERLIRAIRRPQDRIVVHLDTRVGAPAIAGFRSRLSDLPNVDVFSMVACRWGGYSIVEATLQALQRLLDHPFLYGSLLSGSDYPVRSIDDFATYLHQNHAQEYVSVTHEGLPGETPDDLSNRFSCYWPYERLVSSRRKRLSSIRLQGALGVDRKLPAGLLPTFGSQWFTLTREAIETIVQGMLDPEIKRFFARTAIPDEMEPHMLLRNSKYWANRATDNLRYTATDEKGRFPKLLTRTDLADILKSSAFFCRKIEHGEDAGLCDQLDDLRARSRGFEAAN
ncbi:beta-1,6-N-acetylglucosaminyltransferase [Mesorhizobium sp. VK25A]|uniref:Peptide O-xylosyltransferase n=1 Tax=Mesorhizobium vachelliae TaxID=3072309 RepID=A0ABU5A4L7_9HYPH|nr:MULTISPECIES: beta-1,6-N-acetylglucosaminyltransferase [unclassified Mesorhizobium]MDX8531146.1 beta-1,6-N-acetylglucosaminyltransferase [Mesorhizobium sp. VK25D]MDX8543103.1 beta-1,6-N-acetylglucosaminyltransferase [Mesorhizobium sp. VK25A]